MEKKQYNELLKMYQELLDSGITYDEMMELLITDYMNFKSNDINETNIQTVFISEDESEKH